MQGLTSLRKLHLYDNLLISFPPTCLREISASIEEMLFQENQLTALDTSLVDALPELVTLWLHKNKISDFSYISALQLPLLNSLRLDDNEVTHNTSICNQHAHTSRYAQVHSLLHAYRQVSELPMLAGMTKLTKLYMSNNKLVDLPPSRLPCAMLDQIWFNGNRISSITPGRACALVL